MRERRYVGRSVAACVAIGLVSMAAPASAGAATQIGETFTGGAVGCTANNIFIQSISPGGQYAAPFAGIITSWSHHAAGSPPQLKLKVVRSTGGNNFTIVGDSGFKTPTANALNTYTDVRIPVQALDLIGFYTQTNGGAGCQRNADPAAYARHTGAISDPPPGAPVTLSTFAGIQLNVSATLEADGDGDGFGDETQDGCPTDASTQKPCNDFSFGKVKRNKRKGTATLTVNVPGPGVLDLAKTKKVKGADEPVEAEGQEKLPIKAKGKANKKLNEKGKAKVNAEVTFTPTGGDPNTESKKIKLVKR